jgi:hypothetical protein
MAGRCCARRSLRRRALVFVTLSRPESASWYQRLIANDQGLHGQDRVDALAALSWLGQQFGDWATAESLAAESCGLAEAEGLAPSPWAGMAAAMVGVYTGSYEGVLTAARAAVAAAESNRDEFAAVLALSMVSNGLGASGEMDAMRSRPASTLPSRPVTTSTALAPRAPL